MRRAGSGDPGCASALAPAAEAAARAPCSAAAPSAQDRRRPKAQIPQSAVGVAGLGSSGFNLNEKGTTGGPSPYSKPSSPSRDGLSGFTPCSLVVTSREPVRRRPADCPTRKPRNRGERAAFQRTPRCTNPRRATMSRKQGNRGRTCEIFDGKSETNCTFEIRMISPHTHGFLSLVW